MLAHRGPDSSGVETSHDGNVVLEHTRLAIIDPDNRDADQPFWDPTRRWAMTYNGEVFNFREIRAALEAEGVQFRTDSDTEVVLLGFIRWGERVLDRLIGMFAFVVWDSRTGDLFAARDQIGVKPLYYFARNGMFAAASEVRALLAHPNSPSDLDRVSVVEFLAFGNNFGDRTVIDGISKLPPAHYLRLQGDTLTVTKYWDVLPTAGAGGTAEWLSELRARLDTAVEASLVSDVPVGLMLSGGLDSSAIAALAVQHVDARALTAYSVSFGLPDDESEVAARLAQDLGIRHRTLVLSEREVQDEFDSWLTSIDYPSGDPTWIATWIIARAAREDGIKVLLSGDGGDELFGGYNRWMKYLRFHDHVWRRTPRVAKRIAGRAARTHAHGLAADIARRAATDGHLFVPSRPMHDDVLRMVLGSEGQRVLAEQPPELLLEPVARAFSFGGGDGDYLAWMSYVSLKTTLVEDFLQRLDKMGMQHSVEGRVPLLDPRLAAWAFSIPQQAKVGRFEQKRLFRKAVTGVVPSYITDRPKQGFSPPVATWVETLLAGRTSASASQLVDAGLVRADVQNVLAQRGHSYAAWTLGTLSTWLDHLPTSALA